MTNINYYYSSHVIHDLRVGEDKEGLFVRIPSEKEKNTKYTVRCTEHADSVSVESCTCMGFYHRKQCKHVEIVKEYWNGTYHSNTTENTVEYQKRVNKVAAKAVQDFVEAPAVDAGSVGNLNGTREFSVLR